MYPPPDQQPTNQHQPNPPTESPPPLQVPVYIGGAGLPKNVVLREDLPNAGLANITATYINLLGLQAPQKYQPSLITTDE